MKILRALTCGLGFVLAQSFALAEPAAQPTLTAHTASGQPVSLQALRGQVVMVLVWSTDCPVCLSKMPELRANHAGWLKQGFQIIGVNTDAKPEALRSWESARQITVPAARQWPSVWSHGPGFSTSLPLVAGASANNTAPAGAAPPAAAHLPLIYVVDRAGKLRFQSSGRMPAEVWDTIAELL